jgi:aminoglycoside phosphotransferase (APT) family kinase protein
VTRPGRLLAAGRATEVFELGDNAVLRRYRAGERCDVEREDRAMRFLHDQGYPVPAVLEVGEREMVMERVEGPTMLADLARHPWRIGAHAHTLAELHDRLHAITAPEWLPKPVRLPEGLAEGDRMLHLDLHPENVLLSHRGPVVIDWTGASRGPAAADIAITWVIMGTSTVPGSPLVRSIASLGRGAFVSAFLRRCGRDDATALLPEVARRRLELDQHLLPEERRRLKRLAEPSRR